MLRYYLRTNENFYIFLYSFFVIVSNTVISINRKFHVQGVSVHATFSEETYFQIILCFSDRILTEH